MNRDMKILIAINVVSALALGIYYANRHYGLAGLWHRPAEATATRPAAPPSASPVAGLSPASLPGSAPAPGLPGPGGALAPEPPVPAPVPAPAPGPGAAPAPAPGAPTQPGSPLPALAMPAPSPSAATPAPQGQPLATLAEVQGSVKSKAASAAGWQDARQKMPLYGNDSVRTFEKSSASISFGASNVVNVDQNTLVILQPPQGKGGGDEVTLSTLPGDFLDRLVELPAAERAKALGAAVAKTRVTIRTVTESGRKPERARVAVRSLPDKSAGLEAVSGTLKVMSPRGQEVILKERTVTKIGGEALLAVPRALPAAPEPIFPQDGATYGFNSKVPRVEVKWKSVENAKKYRLVVASDRAFRGIFVDETVEGTSLALSNLQPGSYFWRVGAVDADGFQGPYSAIRSLRTAYDDQPPKLTLLSPPEMFVSPQPSTELKGKTEPAARVKVNGQRVTVAADGSFGALLTLKEGVNLITVEAVDLAGNSEYGKRVITYKGSKRSTAAPASGTP